MTDLDFDFAPDHFLEALGRATGRVYPSPKVIQWGDRLVAQYGESNVIKALGRASTEVESHEVMSRAEQLLEYATAISERVMEREEEEQRRQAREDRNRRELEYQRGLGSTSTSAQPLSELMPDVRLGKARGDE